MLTEKVWAMMAVMIILPMIFILVLPDPYGNIATIITSLVLVFYLRKFSKNMASGLFGGKLKYQCLVCQGMKFDSKGTCVRCGGKSKKPI